MARSAILTGRFQQRDRAQLRGRRDRHRPSEPPAHAELTAWLGAEVRADDLGSIEMFDWEAFLRSTAQIALPAHERLRLLAVHLESELTWREQPREWLAHERVYIAAKGLGPRDEWVHLSRALSAEAHARALDRDDEAEWRASAVRRRMMRTARDAIGEALAIDPESVDARVVMGQHCYFDPDAGPAEALSWYEAALERSPDGWAYLYRAHCLHDLAR